MANSLGELEARSCGKRKERGRAATGSNNREKNKAMNSIPADNRRGLPPSNVQVNEAVWLTGDRGGVIVAAGCTVWPVQIAAKLSMAVKSRMPNNRIMFMRAAEPWGIKSADDLRGVPAKRAGQATLYSGTFPHMVGHGFANIPAAMEALKKRVSAQKIMVSL